MMNSNLKTAVLLSAIVGLGACKKKSEDEVEQAAQALAAEPTAAAEQAQRLAEEAEAQAEAAEKAAQEAALAASAAAGAADSAEAANLGEGDEVAAPTPTQPTPPPARPAPPPGQEERRGLAPKPDPKPAPPPKKDEDGKDGKRTFKERKGVSKKRLPGQGDD